MSLCQTTNGSQTLLFPSPNVEQKKKETSKQKTTVTTKSCASTSLSLYCISYAATERAIFLLLPFFLPHNSFLNKPPLLHFLLGKIAREPTAVSSASLLIPFKLTNFFGSSNVPFGLKVGLVLACRRVGDF